MSQKKVDLYKERKANREKIYKKEKMILRIEKTIAILVCVVIIGWVGYSVVGQYQKSQDAKETETVMDATAIDTYLNELQTTDTE